MTLDPVLFLNSLASGLLLGAFYALAASGLAVAFGLLDVVNIAHPAIMVAAAFAVSALSEATGLDPALATVVVAAPFAAYLAAPSVEMATVSSSSEGTMNRFEASPFSLA